MVIVEELPPVIYIPPASPEEPSARLVVILAFVKVTVVPLTPIPPPTPVKALLRVIKPPVIFSVPPVAKIPPPL